MYKSKAALVNTQKGMLEFNDIITTKTTYKQTPDVQLQTTWLEKFFSICDFQPDPSVSIDKKHKLSNL